MRKRKVAAYVVVGPQPSNVHHMEIQIQEGKRMTSDEYGTMIWRITKWKSPEHWNNLRNGIDCPLCADMHLEENQFSFKVVDLQQSAVRLPKNQHLRGWTIVVFNRHANELFDLSDQELFEYWQDVAKVAKALHQLYQPTKINYCIFGHHIPHIHCHLLVHSYSDDPSKPVKMDEEEQFLSGDDYQTMIRELRNSILPR